MVVPFFKGRLGIELCVIDNLNNNRRCLFWFSVSELQLLFQVAVVSLSVIEEARSNVYGSADVDISRCLWGKWAIFGIWLVWGLFDWAGFRGR
jgi:hypothetical protein